MLQHADDSVSLAVDGQSLAQGVAPKGVFRQIASNDTHLASPLHVQPGEEPSLAQLLPAVDGALGTVVEHDLADSVERGLVKFFVPLADGGLGVHIGGNTGEHVRVFLHQIIHILGVQGRGGPIPSSPDIGHHHVDPQLIHLLLHHAGQAVAQGQDNDDGGHADDDAQHGEQGAHLAGGQGLDGQAEGLSIVHTASTSSSAASGWTTARGSWASPS